jgi:sugar-phosphatase
VAVGSNAGELPDGVLHIPDYSAVTVTTGVTGAGLRTLSFTF